ncbi:hypothetical protein QAD02_018676 [Eretmocerus hayati]|uniref:Uncharacterized protein n=1 Tax=Eretmocerus hayati TaxID=131215 RepID=A0ACC2PH15_9HYME|nr:hypothetical protein QAD02_018676 [Eretmocerus hayati]
MDEERRIVAKELKLMLTNGFLPASHYKSFSTDGKVEDYKRIYSLRGGLYPHELEEYSKVSSLIVVLLAKHSSILGNRYEYHQIEKLMKNEEAITLGALLLKTSKIVVLNCQGVWGYNDLCRNNPGGGMCTSECCGKKAYMAPSMSLIPLSCCPNVSRGVMNDDRGITFTLSPIKKGDQLFSSIYSVYKLAPKAQRQKVYRKRYGRDCECQACENDWTEADFLTERTIESFMSESKMMEKFNAAKTSRAMKRNSDIGTLLQMKELVQEAWKYYALPSDILINSVKAFLEMVDIIYCKSGSKMPSKCSNCD